MKVNKCHNCGANISQDTNICKYCGTDFNDEKNSEKNYENKQNVNLEESAGNNSYGTLKSTERVVIVFSLIISTIIAVVFNVAFFIQMGNNSYYIISKIIMPVITVTFPIVMLLLLIKSFKKK
jgi:uncharacterized membrane protein YvbJ